MNRGRRAFLGLAGALLVPAVARAQDADEPIDRVLEEVARARADLRTLTGPFTQTRSIGLLAAKVPSTGTLTLVRPDRLRWQLAPPDDVTYWMTPEGLAYRSRTGQGRVQGASPKLAATLEDLRTLLSGDLALLRARYDLRVRGAAGGPVSFEGTPRPGSTSPPLERLLFSLAADRITPTHATIVEGPRDRTDIVFGNLVKNAPVDPALVRPPF